MNRVLFLAADLCSGGAERQMVTVACLLKNAGYDVSFYCYDKAYFYAVILQDANIPVIWELEPMYIRRIYKVRRFIRRGNYDAVISFLPTCNFLNDIAAIGGHSWKVITGERSARESTFKSMRGKLFGWFQRYSGYIVCNSYNASLMWQKMRPDYIDKLRVIYNSVQLGIVHSSYVPKKDGKLHIIVAATYQYLKNPLGLIEALSIMNEDEKKLFVIDWYGRQEISGDTRAYDDTVEAIKKYKLENVLILHSDTKDIADKMYQADAVMLLSKFEGLPNVICEGMMLGKPIIMTRVSDYNELVDNWNGLLCDWNNPETIKKAILSMSEMPKNTLLELGASSKSKAVKLFSDELICSQWMQLIG